MVQVHIPGPTPAYFKECIDEFLLELRAAGRSYHTIRGYGYHLYRFARWLEDQGIQRMEDWGKREALRWMNSLWDRLEPTTIKQAAQALRAWVRWLAHQGIKPNFAHEIPSPRPSMTPQRTFTLEEIRKLFQACDPNTPRGARDLALMAILLETGLRASEVISLRVSDWNGKDGTLLVQGKGRRKDVVRCSPDGISYLENWLRFRDEIAQPDVESLLVSVGGLTPGRPLTQNGLRVILRRIGQKAGVPGVHPHAFRRTFTVLLLKAGVPTRILQVLGRWRDLRMVERYSQALMAQEAWETVKDKSPLHLLRNSF